MHQPLQTYRGNGGVYLQDGDKSLQDGDGGVYLQDRGSGYGSKHQTVSAAGRVYWEQILGEKAPLLYAYNQPLLQDKFVKTRDGRKLQVRRRGADGNFTVLPAGAAYFRHHRSLWIPLIPRVIINRPNGGEYTARKAKNAIHYVPLANMPQLTTATLRERTGGQRGEALVATDEEQKAETIAAARAYILTLDTMVVGGKTYHILFHDSQVDHAFDAGLPTSSASKIPHSTVTTAPLLRRRYWPARCEG